MLRIQQLFLFLNNLMKQYWTFTMDILKYCRCVQQTYGVLMLNDSIS